MTSNFAKPILMTWILVVGLVPLQGDLLAQQSEEFQEPELLYLGWRLTGADGEVRYPLWRPDGTTVSGDESHSVHQALQDAVFLMPGLSDRAQFLVLIFSVDSRATEFPLKPNLELSGEPPLVTGAAQVGIEEPWVVTGIYVRTDLWPDTGLLKVSWPFAQPTQFWSSDKPPFEDTQIADGITCAIRRDANGQYLETGFQPGVGDWERNNYQVRAWLEDQPQPVPVRPPLLTGTVSKHQYELSQYFDADDLNKIIVTRQPCRQLELGKIVIRADLLPRDVGDD